MRRTCKHIAPLLLHLAPSDDEGGENEDDDEDEDEEEEDEGEANDMDPELLSRVEEQTPALLKLTKQFKEHLQELRGKLAPLQQKVAEGKTGKGLGFLEVKNQLLLGYLTRLGMFTLLKSGGQSVEGHPIVTQLIEIRTILEKLKPLDQKLHYQVEKLLKLAVTGRRADTGLDPMRFKPQLTEMVGDADGKEALGDGEVALYEAPKVAAAHFEEGREGTKASKEKRKEERQRRLAEKSGLLGELRNELFDAPEESHVGGAKAKRDHDEEERQRYEEETFNRMTLTKEEKKKQKAHRRSLGGLEGMDKIEDIGDFSAIFDERDQAGAAADNVSALLKKKSLKRQLAGMSSRPSGGKKARR